MVSIVVSIDSYWILIIVLQFLMNLYIVRRFWQEKDAIFERVLISFIKKNKAALASIGKSIVMEQLQSSGSKGAASGGIEGMIGGIVQKWVGENFGGAARKENLWG